MTDPLLQWVVALALALLFAGASWHKRSAPVHFRAQLHAYSLVPDSALKSVATALPWFELAIALGLLVVPLRAGAGLAAASLLLVYATGMLINLLRGRRDIDCGCGGPAQPLSYGLVVRNLLLATAAVTLTMPPVARAFGIADLLWLGALVALLSLTYAAVAQIFSNAGALRGWSAHES